MPAEYGRTPKPHIAFVGGQWWAFWPQWYTPAESDMRAFRPWLRKMNGFPEMRPTSFLMPAHESCQ